MPNSIKNNILRSVLPGDDILSRCIHCGMCLATCPTYELTKMERSSPRGRIKLINAVAKGEMGVTDLFNYEMNFCLDCQACETACPAGVKYGIMVEAARVESEQAGCGSFLGKITKKIVFKFLISRHKNLKAAARILFLYQNSKIRKFIHSSYLINKIFHKIIEADNLAPLVSRIFSSDTIPEILPPGKKVKYKIAFLTGCLMDVMFADVNKDTVDVLNFLGCEVYSPKTQVCCGSLPGHTGDFETAGMFAKKNIIAFEKYDYDYLISNSSGCGAFMKEYKYLLRDDVEFASRAEIFSNKVKDILEFISENYTGKIAGVLNEIVTYHDACHHVHSQKIYNEPRNILNSINGLSLNEMEESTWCCGSAGIYNITHYTDSMKLLERKMKHISNTKAKIVLAANHGCIAQLKYGAVKFNVDVEVQHPVTLIKNALLNL